MPILAVSKFNWPALQTEEIAKPEKSELLRSTFQKWQAICHAKQLQLPFFSGFFSDSREFDTLYSVDKLLSHLVKMKFRNARCFVVRDRAGDLQGVAIVKEKESAVEIDTLMTSPENLGKNRKIGGVGTLLIKRIAHELLLQKCSKPIELTPTEVAIGFYEKLGFQGALTVRDTKCMSVQPDKIAELYTTCSKRKSI